MLVVAVVGMLAIATQPGWRWQDAVSVVRPRESRPAEPRDTIYRMLDAARAGDVNGYLACYGEPLRKQLKATQDEMTFSGFGKYLTERNREIKGIAISEAETLSATRVKIRVEYVYQDRNETQDFHLGKLGGEWRITQIDGAERVETLVPYGTPVY
jgi:hypothetical protein